MGEMNGKPKLLKPVVKSPMVEIDFEEAKRG